MICGSDNNMQKQTFIFSEKIDASIISYEGVISKCGVNNIGLSEIPQEYFPRINKKASLESYKIWYDSMIHYRDYITTKNFPFQW